MLHLVGTQQSILSNNKFVNTNVSGTTIQYIDFTRANHILQKNSFEGSGTVARNKYVVEEGNLFK